MKNSKERKKRKQISPVYLQDDMTPKDLSLKDEARSYMKEAHSKGLELRFDEGRLKITGRDNTKKEIPNTIEGTI